MSEEKIAVDIETTKLESWSLLAGNHDFPGPDGGTCINEAAIIARGFEYRSVSNYDDFPPCFSKVIGQFALQINDELSDYTRNKLLMPFICRLPGTKDRKRVEIRRALFILNSLCDPCTDTSKLPVGEMTDLFDSWDIDWRELKPNKFNTLVKQVMRGKYPNQRLLDNDINVDAIMFRPEEEIVTNEYLVGTYLKKNTPESLVEILDKAILMGKHESIANIEIINQRFKEYKQKAINDEINGE